MNDFIDPAIVDLLEQHRLNNFTALGICSWTRWMSPIPNAVAGVAWPSLLWLATIFI